MKMGIAKMVETVLEWSWGFTFFVWGILVYAGWVFDGTFVIVNGTKNISLVAGSLPIAGLLAGICTVFGCFAGRADFKIDKKYVMNLFGYMLLKIWEWLIPWLILPFVDATILHYSVDFNFLFIYFALCFGLAFWVSNERLSLLKTFVFSFILSPIIVYIFVSIYKKDEAENEKAYHAKLDKMNEHMHCADDFERNEDYVNALAEYTEAIETAPDDDEKYNCYRKRANVYYDQKDYASAIADYTKALELASEDGKSVCYRMRAIAYLEQKDYVNAIANYTKALEIAPADDTIFNKSYYYVKRAEAYFAQKDYTNAIADYTKLIELASKCDKNYNESSYRNAFAKVYSARAKVYLKQEDYASAIDDCTKVIELNPEDGWNYRERADVYFEQKDYENAVTDYTKAIEIDPENMKLLDYVKRAKVYFAQKDYTNAIADYTKAIEIDSNESYCYEERAKVYLEIGDTTQAEADFAKAKELKEKQ